MQDRLCQPASVVDALSPSKALFTLTQNILGAGVLALPFAIRSGGIVGGFGLLTLIYFLTVCSMGALVLLANCIGEFSYKGQAVKTFGGGLSTLFEVWVLCYTLGICIGYPILLGDFLSSIIHEMGAADWCTPQLCMIVAVLTVCWPFSCAPTLGTLGKLSVLGVLFITSTVVIVIYRYADGSYGGRDEGGVKAFVFKDFGSCFPILVGAFGAHFNIPALYKEVAPQAGAADWGTTIEGRAAFRTMMRVIVWSLTVCAAIYAIGGGIVYATFGNLTQDDFTKNFKQDDPLIIFVRGTMALSICISFPLVMVSARTAVFNLVLRPRGWEMSALVRIGLTSVLVLLCLGLALLAGGDLGTVLAYNGSIFGTPICYVAPALMYLRLPKASQKPLWRYSSLLCAVLGIGFGIFGIITVTINHVNAATKHRGSKTGDPATMIVSFR